MVEVGVKLKLRCVESNLLTPECFEIFYYCIALFTIISNIYLTTYFIHFQGVVARIFDKSLGDASFSTVGTRMLDHLANNTGQLETPTEDGQGTTLVTIKDVVVSK